MVRIILFLTLLVEASAMAAPRTAADEPLLNWQSWEKYRATVKHPAAIIKPMDVARARENQKRYAWARSYAASVEGQGKRTLELLTPEYLTQMIPDATPGDTLFTPCPACRDLGKPAHPHGQYAWNPNDPEHLTCQVCRTVFPNDKYPESLVRTTTYGKPQQLSFYGGAPFVVFGFLTRPSFTANIRARKVGYMASLCQRLGEAYLLTGDPDYAAGTRKLLLRFASVYPNWLVHVGYCEFADCDPHVAALNITQLPNDEINSGASKPDRRLHTGYWSAGRASGTGMEAGFVRQMLEAYDFTCEAQRDGQPIYSDAERRQIEHDLILESTVLLVADKAVNNKSVGNATAVALVGMAMGYPEMVRFGLDVFLKTVDGWFLADGGTSESWSYACMTLSGINSLGQAFRGYSDPPGYKDAEGKRLEKLDLYHDTAYKRVWEAMLNGLQGDLRYPPLADGHAAQTLGADFVELMADNYPENPQYLALLREMAGPDLSRGSAHHATYFREPGLSEKPSPSLTLPDYAFPVLSFGQLRSGETGRDSLLLLSASDWGGHHHLDSLNLYYWQQGKELLSDLGYLWDHPMKPMTTRTFAHNTVMVDGQEQRTTGRGGKFTLFASGSPLKLMEAESSAYQQATLYRRTVAQVEHAPGRQYVLDVFRVQGGQRHEYVFHGPNDQPTWEGPPADNAAVSDAPAVRGCLRLWTSDDKADFVVDEVSITGPDGKEIFPNPQATKQDDTTGRPLGFGHYSGDGKAELSVAEGHGDQAGVRLRVLEAGKDRTNQALMLGDSDGYKGDRAFQFLPGAHYKVTFWVKGNGTTVQGSVLYWNGDPPDAAHRASLELRGATAFIAGPEWQKITAEFAFAGGLDLEQIRSSGATGQWKATWQVGEGLALNALWPNEAGFTTFIGEGWGQRDYRNSDVGAKLPYIVRRHAAGPRPTAYVSVFEGYAEGEAVVKTVRQLPVPESEAANTVAVAVDTVAGTDYFVSCLEARPVTIATPAGSLEINGRAGLVSVVDGKVTAASLVEGTVLKLAGKAVAGG